MNRSELAALNPLHILIDAETTSLSAEARIIGLAAAAVDRTDGAFAASLLWSRFPISAVEQEGRIVDPRTMEWWQEVGGEPGAAAQAAMLGEGGDLVSAIRDLLDTVRDRTAGRPVIWWGDPSAFDGALQLTVLDPMRLGAAAAAGNPLAVQLLPLAEEELKLGHGVPLYKRVLDVSTCKWLRAFAGQAVPDYEPTVKHDPREDVLAAGRELAEMLTEQYAIGGRA